MYMYVSDRGHQFRWLAVSVWDIYLSILAQCGYTGAYVHVVWVDQCV